MWIVFYGDKEQLIYEIGNVFNSMDRAIDEVINYAYEHQDWIDLPKKDKKYFKKDLISKIKDYEFPFVEYNDFGDDHVGITLVPMGDQV